MNQPQLQNLVVAPEDIDAGYHPKHQQYLDYQMVMTHAARARDNKPGDFARERGIKRTRDKKEYARFSRMFYNWVKNGRVPVSVQTILALHRIGIFPASQNAAYDTPESRLIHDEIEPFDYKNGLLPVINLLSCYGFWRGNHLQQTKTTGSSYDFHKNFVDPAIVEILEKLIGRKIQSADSNDRISLDAIHSRFLTCLGTVQGNKGESDRSIPGQVKLAINSLKNPDTNPEEVMIALYIVRDFVLSFFFTEKCNHSASRGYSTSLPFSQSDAIAEERAELFRDSVRLARFNFSTRAQRASQLGGKGMKTPTYSRIIFFDGIEERDIQILKDEFHRRIGEIGSLIL